MTSTDVSAANSNRSLAPSPRPHFEAQDLKPYVKTLLSTTLATATWPDAKDYSRVKGWCREISLRVKERMLSEFCTLIYVRDVLNLVSPRRVATPRFVSAHRFKQHLLYS